jgi:hypothetical protein
MRAIRISDSAYHRHMAEESGYLALSLPAKYVNCHCKLLIQPDKKRLIHEQVALVS